MGRLVALDVLRPRECSRLIVRLASKWDRVTFIRHIDAVPRVAQQAPSVIPARLTCGDERRAESER